MSKSKLLGYSKNVKILPVESTKSSRMLQKLRLISKEGVRGNDLRASHEVPRYGKLQSIIPDMNLELVFSENQFNSKLQMPGSTRQSSRKESSNRLLKTEASGVRIKEMNSASTSSLWGGQSTMSVQKRLGGQNAKSTENLHSRQNLATATIKTRNNKRTIITARRPLRSIHNNQEAFLTLQETNSQPEIRATG